MCLAIPARVVAFSPEQPHVVTVDVEGIRRNVNVALLEGEGLGLGDWVLIHVGFALSKVDAAEAQAQLALLRSLGEVELALEEVEGYSA